jgi:hypothetical protein
VMVLGSYAVGAIATFDRDGDGDEDLLLGDAAHSVVHVLLREPDGYVHTVAPLLVGPCAADAGIGALAGGDLDGDGDGDVLAWNRGTLNTHSVFDATSGSQRLREVRGDIRGATIGNVVELPVAVELPVGLLENQPTATSFRLRFHGWLVDPISGLVQPQRVVDHEVLIDASHSAVATTVAFALPATGLASFHLQLVAGVVAIMGTGERRPLPATLVHMTNDPVREAAIQNTVAGELTGNPHGKLGGDGGGDGNILGAKTGKHQIGAPPE